MKAWWMWWIPHETESFWQSPTRALASSMASHYREQPCRCGKSLHQGCRIDAKKFHSPCRFPRLQQRRLQAEENVIRSVAAVACRCVESARGLRTS
jgi:hypothetical protein